MINADTLVVRLVMWVELSRVLMQYVLTTQKLFAVPPRTWDKLGWLDLGLNDTFVG